MAGHREKEEVDIQARIRSWEEEGMTLLGEVEADRDTRLARIDQERQIVFELNNKLKNMRARLGLPPEEPKQERQSFEVRPGVRKRPGMTKRQQRAVPVEKAPQAQKPAGAVVTSPTIAMMLALREAGNEGSGTADLGKRARELLPSYNLLATSGLLNNLRKRELVEGWAAPELGTANAKKWRFTQAGLKHMADLGL